MPPSVGSVEMTNSGALDVHADLHAAAVTAVDAAVGGLGGDDELGLDAVLVVDVLPAHAVAVLFLDGAHDHDLVALGDEVEVLHDLGSVGGGADAALLVGAAAAVDDVVGLIALVGVGVPVVDVADAHGVDVAVEGDDLVAVAHEAHDVAQAVDLDLVEAELLHLVLDDGDDLALLAALAGLGDHGAQEGRHVGTVLLGRVLDLLVVKLFAHCNSSSLLELCLCGPLFEGGSYVVSGPGPPPARTRPCQTVATARCPPWGKRRPRRPRGSGWGRCRPRWRRGARGSWHPGPGPP